MTTVYDVLGDWGTSRLRLFRVEDGQVVDRCEGPGIGIPGATPQAKFRQTLAPWSDAGLPRAIRLCGMVGARSGWTEVPYIDCPADAALWQRGGATLDFDGVPLSIRAGLACADANGYPDVMRGEETQIFGAIASDPRLGSGRHMLALPGTHCKWALVQDGRITGFHTFPTGELFALLRDHSTLGGPAGTDAEQSIGFTDGLARAGEGDHLLGSLFLARAMPLRAGRSPGWAAGFLSGLLIGGEVAEIQHRYSDLQNVFLIGDPHMADLYARALAARAVATTRMDGDACVLAGLALTDR